MQSSVIVRMSDPIGTLMSGGRTILLPPTFRPMDRTPVSSSNLRSVGYDQDDQILEIEFNSGGVYRYFGVPSNIHADLMNASSHGKYFHSKIKDVYRFEQVR